MLAIANLDEVKEWRRYLHSVPEPGHQETTTANFVAEKLRGFGLEVHERIGKTGVVGVLQKGQGNRGIALRADMDALKIRERTGLPYQSTHEGYMHACGHDGHTAMLLGAARYLAASESFSGTVVFIFQPNEEHGRGAQSMIDDGLFERFAFEEIYGIHNSPGLPVGSFATCVGPCNASEDNFVIQITGKGGHAARPQASNDPIVIAANIILALQTIVSRRVSPLEKAVVSVTEILTDGTRNVLPHTVTIKGDTRSYEHSVQMLIEREMRSLCGGIAAAFNAEVDVEYSYEFAPVINHPQETEHAIRVAQALFGSENVDGSRPPAMGSEDFGLFLKHKPGNFAYLGNGIQGAAAQPLHNPFYDFNDDAIEAGIAYWSALVHARLPAERENLSK